MWNFFSEILVPRDPEMAIMFIIATGFALLIAAWLKGRRDNQRARAPKVVHLPPAKEPRPRQLDRVSGRFPRGIQSTDLGMRKLRRHRSGRLHDRRSGFDPDKRMIDIEDDQTRSQRKKRTWFEDRKRA